LVSFHSTDIIAFLYKLLHVAAQVFPAAVKPQGIMWKIEALLPSARSNKGDTEFTAPTERPTLNKYKYYQYLFK